MSFHDILFPNIHYRSDTPIPNREARRTAKAKARRLLRASGRAYLGLVNAPSVATSGGKNMASEQDKIDQQKQAAMNPPIRKDAKGAPLPDPTPNGPQVERPAPVPDGGIVGSPAPNTGAPSEAHPGVAVPGSPQRS